MKVKIHEQTIDIDNQSSNFKELCAEIESVFQVKQLVLDHMEIDGVELYEGYEEFFAEHWPDIQEVIVASQSINQLVLTTLATTHEYLERALPLMESLAEQLYRGPNEQLWKDFIQMLDGFQWLMESAKLFIDNYPTLPEFQKFLSVLEPKIVELGEAMESSDSILMADLLSYEILPELRKFDEQIAKLLVEEGDGKDVN